MPENPKKTERFTFLCTPPERRLLTVIADYLDRSQGDAVRQLIRIAAQELEIGQKTGGELRLQLDGIPNLDTYEVEK